MTFSIISHHFIMTILLTTFFRDVHGNNLTLVLAQVLYRHGDRSPLMTFTNDKWQNYWPGIGQLTKIGMMQEYELGQYFRQRYNPVFNLSVYRREDIRVRSTDFERTLMSAYCNLAGLYPPTGHQIWNEEIRWQPIPVHTVPAADDYLLSGPSNCPRYNNLWNNDKKNTKLTEKQQKMLTFVREKTGDQLDISNFGALAELFWIQKIHNLTVPDWASVFLNEYKDKAIDEENNGKSNVDMEDFINREKEINRLEGGPLLGELMKNMQNKIIGDITEKIFMYSGHDTTFQRLSRALKVPDTIKPSYCATIMVELYKDDNNDTFVQIFYHNMTSEAPFELATPNCSTPCPFEQFKSLHSDMAVYDYAQACQELLGTSGTYSDNLSKCSTIIFALFICSFVINFVLT